MMNFNSQIVHLLDVEYLWVMKMNQLNKRITFLYNIRKHHVSKIISNYNINELEYNILGIIYVNESLTIDDLCEKMKYSKNVMQVIIEELKEKGYIVLENDVIVLTEKGLSVLKEIKKDTKKIANQLCEKIEDSDYQQILEMLDILIDTYEQ